MAEGSVGLVGHEAEIGIRDLAGGERLDDVDGDFPVRPAKETGDGLLRELRPDLGHVKAAVAGKPGQHHIAKAQYRSLAPGRNITRQAALQRLRDQHKPLIHLLYTYSMR